MVRGLIRQRFSKTSLRETIGTSRNRMSIDLNSWNLRSLKIPTNCERFVWI